jgi:hypothetical protein
VKQLRRGGKRRFAATAAEILAATPQATSQEKPRLKNHFPACVAWKKRQRPLQVFGVE